MKEVETRSGSITSTKQFIWDSGVKPREARDASSSITAQYFSRGQTMSGTSYYYTLDDLGSVREMANSSGTVEGQLGYDPYGRATLLQGSIMPDFQYAGYYYHAASELSLTLNRAYSPFAGRWINRDPIQEGGGTNLYAYVDNNPISGVDPLGLAECFNPCKDQSNGYYLTCYGGSPLLVHCINGMPKYVGYAGQPGVPGNNGARTGPGHRLHWSQCQKQPIWARTNSNRHW